MLFFNHQGVWEQGKNDAEWIYVALLASLTSDFPWVFEKHTFPTVISELHW